MVTLQGGGYLNDIGKPMLPMKNILVALPAGMKVTSIQILDVQEQPIKGTYLVYPAQKPLPVGTSFDEHQFVQPDAQTYASLQPYPPSLINSTDQSDLAGQNMADITVYPLHYVPAERQLTLVSSIIFSLKGTGGYVCGDYLPLHISGTDEAVYQKMVKDMVINPENVELRTAPNPQPLGVGPGNYEYVIITQDSWVSAFQPLANWKTQKGVPATIVTTDWIYNNGGYSGSNVQQIRAFVQDAYNTWGTTYVLLGGDIDVVPYKNTTFSSVEPDPVPNDAYYADFDSDYVCEVNIGRASVTGTGNGTGGIANFIYKVMTYETNPPLTNYAKKVGLFGFDLDSWTNAEQCKININNSYIPTSWTVKTVYDSQSGNHRTNVIDALNKGQNIVNHADHSNSDCMGTGFFNHNLLIYNQDIDALTNGNKQTIMYSIGCDPAAYDINDSIAEHFVQNPNGGGIAFIGNSRYGWFEYGTYDTLSMGFDVHFFKSLFQEGLYNLGAAFSDHKNDAYQEYPGDEHYQYCFTELTLLGDPELPIWTENPTSLTVSHPGSLPVGTSSFYVAVSSGGNPVNQAYVCLWKGNEVYQRGYTDATGNVSFTVSPTTEGALNVTVTKHNYLPNKSTALVNLPPYQPNNPTPANGTINISLIMDLSWVGGDPNQGDIVTYDVYFGTINPPPKIISNQSNASYDTVTMNAGTVYYWKIVSWDTHGALATGPLWHFTTHNDPPNTPGNPNPATGTTGVSINANLSWTSGDPNQGDTVTYDVYLGTISPPTTKVSVNQSGTSYDPGTLNYNSQYYWKIVAWDNHGVSTAGSTWNFATENLAPYQPSNPNPPEGTTGAPITTDINWTGEDPDGDTVTYDVYFGTTSMPPKVAGNHYSASYDPGTLTYGTSYYWKIVAWDNHGASTAGPLWDFKTNSLPYEPHAPAPANHTSGIDVNADLTWNGGDPDVSDTVLYDVYFGVGTSPPKVASNQSGTSYDPGTLNYLTTYHWKIVAWDNHGASAAGSVWNFTTMNEPNNPPNIPSDPNPSNGTNGVDVNAVLSWTGGDPDAGDTVTYDVYFGTVNPPGIRVYDQSSTSYDSGTMEYSTTYYWKIIASDNHGAPATSPVWYFMTEVNNPPVFGAPSPSNGSSGMPLTCTWSIPISDPEGDSFNWTTQCCNGQTSGATAASNGTKTLSLSSLSYSTTYKVWVNATDPDGSGLFTLMWYEFTTIAESYQPPYVPPVQTNSPPIANLSAGEPYQGDVKTTIIFDGSKSSDSDGNITKWFWVFGDKTNGTGKIAEHVYSETGTYTVTLIVTDNERATNYATTTCVITQSNRPPTTPSITGPTQGTKNTSYQYTVVSTDADNDTLRYFLIWGDETSYENTSPFLPSGTPFAFSHRWTTPGIYTITVHTSDNRTDSEPAYLIILIDVKYTENLGYLIDQEATGVYDGFYSNSTMNKTSVQRQANGTYLIDTNGDGIMEYWYNPTTGALAIYHADTGKRAPGFDVYLILCATITLLLLGRKRGHLI